MTLALLLTVQIATIALILSIGLGATFEDLLYLWRRPALLLRSLLAMYGLVPAAAFAIVAIWPLAAAVKAALLVLAASAGAPLLPRKLEALGGGKYSFSLVVLTSLLAIVVTPAWVALLAWRFGVAAEISAAAVARAITKAFLLPLAVGMALSAAFPRLTHRVAAPSSVVAGLALTLASVALLVMHWRILLELNLNGMAALLVLLLIAVAIGHLLGGPQASHRTALAVACATRHIGIVMIVATSFEGLRNVVILAAYAIASALVSVPYLWWRRSRSRLETPASEAPQRKRAYS